MKVLIIGHPYFAGKLAGSLSAFDKENTYLSFDTSNNVLDKFRYLFHLLTCDVVYLVGGTIGKSRSIDLALLMKRRVIMHWVGTDILNAVDDYRDKKYIRKYIRNTVHFCEVEWIQEELKQISIEAEILQIAIIDKQKPEIIIFPEQFTILSYVAKGREKFYGLDNIIKLACEFPDISFRIVGINDYQKPIPENMNLLGWVNNMDDQYRDCVLFLRLAEHDGLSFSVLEALAFGRYVGYSQNFRSTYYIKDYNSLKQLVIDLFEKFKGGLLRSNLSAINLIEEEFNKKVVLDNLIHKLEM